MNPSVAEKTTKYDTAEDIPESGSEDHPSWRHNTSSPAVVTVSGAFYFTSLLLFVIFPILAIAIVILHGKLEAGRIDSGFLQGFLTELDPVKGVLASETVRFTGGLHYHPNGTLYRETVAGEPQYVGAPSPDIDSAWDTLLKGNGNYEVALDVMHTLDCVNKIRKALDPGYYHESESPWIHRMHV
ncbi:hypothetical protein CSHISOI_10941, partial [Colletotrichum shisoi]